MSFLSVCRDFPVSMGLAVMLAILSVVLLLRLWHRMNRHGRPDRLAAEIQNDPGQLARVKVELIRGTEKGALTLDGAERLAILLEQAVSQNTDLSHVNMEAGCLSQAQLNGAKLLGANLVNVDLSGASLYGADLRFADLRRAVLRKTDLSHSCLHEAQLDEADLSGADLTGTGLSGAFLKGACLLGVTLSDAQLSEIKTLFDARLDAELARRVSENHAHLLIDPVELFWKTHKIRLATMLKARKNRSARPAELKRFSVPVQGI
jgi:uncharacterized protein YjbI with pentapeptide repeats